METYDAGYTEPYPQGEYYPMDDQGVVIEDQAMIETVVEGEDDTPAKKSYQRLTDDPIYSIEEKIDRMLMGKELSLAERFQRKFGEDLVVDDERTMTSYTPRDMDSEEAKSTKIKGPVPKAKDEGSKKEKKKEEKGEKKAGRFGASRFGGSKGKDKKKKGPSVADLMEKKKVKKGPSVADLMEKDKEEPSDADITEKKKVRKGPSVADLMGKKKVRKGPSVADLMGKKKAVARPKKAPKKVSAIIRTKKPVPEPESEEVEEGGLDFEEFTSFKSMVDDLLENLPEDIIDSFTESPEFKVYESVSSADDFTDEDNEYISIVDDLLEKLPDEIMNEFMESDNFKLYQKIVEWGSE